MTWRCPECDSNNVRPRSRTRDFRCDKCGHVMLIPADMHDKVRRGFGRQPKHLRRVEA